MIDRDLSPMELFDLSTFSHFALFENCVYVWDALKKITPYISQLTLGKIESPVPQGVFLDNPEQISIGKETIIEPGAYIRGPCVVGNHCEIRHGAYIRGDVITGDHCVIGHDTEIKHSVMLDGVKASHFAYLGDCILGNKVNLGAGTKCANFKLDHSPVTIQFEGDILKTGLKKFGAVIGDNTQLGCNSVTNPGTVMGKQSFCYPCVVVRGVVPSKTVVKTKNQTIQTKVNT